MKKVKLSKEQIKEIFADAKNQHEYIIKLYFAVYPDFNKIKQINGFPKVTRTTAEFIVDECYKFDKEKHPDIFAGGLWLNNGFSVSDDQKLKDFEVMPANVTYK